MEKEFTIKVPFTTGKGYYNMTYDKMSAFMVRANKGKLYTLVDNIKIPTKNVRVTEYVKKSRKPNR